MTLAYDQYRAMLPTNKHRLDDELEMQAQVMEDISSEVVKQNQRVQTTKLSLDQIEARLAANIRDDEARITAAQVEGKVKRDPEWIKARQLYVSAVADHGQWLGLLEAWRQKGYSIKTLADLYAAQYFTISSHQSHERLGSNTTIGLDTMTQRLALRRAMAGAIPQETAATPGRRRLVNG